MTWTPADVDRLIRNQVPETPSLEYKQASNLNARDERLEALKDLTGLGNGGGATIFFGIAKDAENPELPSQPSPLNDQRLPGQLEDIVRAGVRPPLLATYTTIPWDAGYVLAVDIQRSPLGPYMVELYGHRQYYLRIGSRTTPMSEQQVRDAYLLAARARERRPQVWKEHLLPLQPLAATPCLCTSALPEEPLEESLHIGALPLRELQPPAELGLHRHTSIVPRDVQIWVHGLYGETRLANGQNVRFRAYRDGSLAWALGFPQEPNHILPTSIARIVHGQLVYMGWFWKQFVVRTPVEVRVELYHLEAGQLWERGDFGVGDARTVPHPGDVTRPFSASLGFEELPINLTRARVRHLTVKHFMDRLYQAYGKPQAPTPMYTEGWLYGPGGQPLGLSVVGGGLCRGNRGETFGRIFEDGYVQRGMDGVGYFVDGVLLDMNGRALAATEMALGAGLPDGFIVQNATDDPLYSCLSPDRQTGRPAGTPPVPRGEWSDRLADLLAQ